MKHLFFIPIVFICTILSANAQKLQGQARLDSMLTELPNMKEDTNKVNLLKDISFQSYAIDPVAGVKYGKTALELSKQLKWGKGVARGYTIIGINYVFQANFDSALNYYSLAREKYEEIGDEQGIATVGNNISQVYLYQGNYPKALEYALASLSMTEKIKSDYNLEGILGSIGTIYTELGEFSKALEYHLGSYKIAEEKNNIANKASAATSIGSAYKGLRNYEKALEYYNIARELAEETGSTSIYIGVTINISELYSDIKDYKTALAYIQLALQKSKEFGNKNHASYCYGVIADIYLNILKRDVVSDSLKTNIANYTHAEDIPEADIPQGRSALLSAAIECLRKRLAISIELADIGGQRTTYEQLYIAYRLKGDYINALEAHEQYVILKDSVFNKENTEKIARLEVKAEYDKKQVADSIQNAEAQKLAEIKLQRQQTMTYSGIGVAVLMLAFSVFIFRNNKKLGIEKAKSETLLNNILPEEIASELKDRGATTAQQYDNVTVLFTDFVNFTIAGERMGSQLLVEELHNCFKAFDEIIDKYGIEKIKTIGDAYLAVCGLPTVDSRHAEKIVLAAEEIRQFMQQRYAQLGDKTFEVRIGVHSGSVVAGIVGVKKFAYDIWGDTVNTAARMESNSEAGKINISQTTYELVRDKFTCTYRGELEAKNKGRLRMYFVEG